MEIASYDFDISTLLFEIKNSKEIIEYAAKNNLQKKMLLEGFITEITKDQIPEDVLRLGVVKGTYKKVKNRYWTVELYKKKKIKKNRKN